MLTATASLIGGNVSANVSDLPIALPHSHSDKEIDVTQKKQTIKGVYKINRNGDAQLIASHRSHSSHRSHRSSSGYSTTPTKKSSSKNSSTTKSSKSSNKKTSVPSSKTSTGSGYSTPLMDSNVTPTQNQVFHLGDREIKNVNIDRGNDVTELVEKLIALGYEIDRSKLDIDAQNKTLYSPVVEKFVIEFKSKNGLSSTGVVDKATVQKLKSHQK